MQRLKTLALIASASMLLTGLARADASLFGARVGATDVPALVKFYESVFGLKEIERIEFPNFLEVLMNFGDTTETAKANAGPRVVVMRRDTNDIKDPIPHLLFSVSDMKAAIAAVKAAGGSVTGEPRPFKNGILILFGVDPAGNQFEMIQPPKS